MAISRISAVSAEAASVTLGTHTTGDLILIFAYRDGSNTAPSLPAGYTTIEAGGANTNSIRAGFKVATSSSETSGTWTNATHVVAHVYRGVSTATVPVGAYIRSHGSSTSPSFGGITMQNTAGTSWIAGFVGCRSIDTTNIAEPAATMTNISSLLGATSDIAYHDTNGGVTSFSTDTVPVGGTASGWTTFVVEILDSTFYRYTVDGTFTAPGDGTVKVMAWGGGGAGGGSDDLSDGGGGGGGGAFSQLNAYSVTNATGYTVEVGAGSTGGDATGGNGTAGQDSWFNTSGTLLAKGGGAGLGTTSGPSGGTGGASASGVGDVKTSGGNGGGLGVDFGSGGGGAGGPGGNGGNGSTSGTAGAAGAGTSTGGSPGAGGAGVADGPGQTGNLPGGAGAGGINDSAGGNGRRGEVWVIFTASSDITLVLSDLSVTSSLDTTALVQQNTIAVADSSVTSSLDNVVFANTAPTVALNSPADTSTTSDTTPTLDFTGTDAEGDDIRYNVQIDVVNTFDSVGGDPELVDSNTTGNSSIIMPGAGGQVGVSQSFTGNGTTAYSVRFKLKKVGSPTGNATFAIYAHSGTFGTSSIPTGSALTSGTIDVTTLTTSPAYYDVVVSPYTLVNATKYVAAVTYSGGTNGVHEVWVDYSNTSVHGGNMATLASSTWSAASTSDAQFSVFSEGTEAQLLDKVSGTDSGFANPDNGGDTDPFTSGENIQYTVQAGDALAVDTYYWRVRGKDPSGSNTYGDWSSTRSFDVAETITLTLADLSVTSNFDTTALTQQNTLALADMSVTSNFDTTALVQQNTIALADLSATSSLDTTVLSLSLILTDLSVTSSLDNTELVQQNTISLADMSVTSQLDTVALTQANTLAVADLSVTAVLDNVVLTQQNTLVTNDLSVNSEVETLELTSGSIITIDDLTVSSSIENTALTQANTLSVQELSVVATLDNTELVQQNTLTVADLESGTTLDTVVLSQSITLTVNDLEVTGNIDGVSLAQANTLALANMSVVSSLDTFNLTQANNLVVSDLDVTTIFDTPDLTTDTPLFLVDLFVGSSLDTMALTQHYSLSLTDLSVTSSIESVLLILPTSLNIQNMVITSTLDSPAVAETFPVIRETSITVTEPDDVELTVQETVSSLILRVPVDELTYTVEDVELVVTETEDNLTVV